MAAPTNVTVESNSITTTVLRWVNISSNQVQVYRSPDGVTYAQVSDDAALGVGSTEFDDIGLSVQKKYWYKLSDDHGATFSDIVTVVTHAKAGPANSEPVPVNLPQFTPSDTGAATPGTLPSSTDTLTQKLNTMTNRLMAALSGLPLNPNPCQACVVDGAVVIDCSTGCNNWQVIADTNINSVTINWCDKFNGTIDFVVPPGVTVGICGFPAGFGFTGNECTDAPVAGGTNGRTLSVSYGGNGGAGVKSSTSTDGPPKQAGKGSGTKVGGGGGGGAACTCVPKGGNLLTIKSCNSGNSLDCNGAKSGIFFACGGVAPYTWSKTGGITIQGTAGQLAGATATGSMVTAKPPTNSGSGVAGSAYQIYTPYTNNARTVTWGCNTQNSIQASATLSYTCNDVPIGVCNTVGTPAESLAGKSPGFSTDTPPAGCGLAVYSDGCAGLTATKRYRVDTRSGAMIAANCDPCGVLGAVTLTVTDAVGTVATMIVKL